MVLPSTGGNGNFPSATLQSSVKLNTGALPLRGGQRSDSPCCSVLTQEVTEQLLYDRREMHLNLAEGDVLLGPELVVPVLRLLPQVSQPFLQLCFILRDVVDDWPQVGERVWWTNPVMCGAGFWSDSRLMQSNKKQRNMNSLVGLIDVFGSHE